jgi:hypothetical protein
MVYNLEQSRLKILFHLEAQRKKFSQITQMYTDKYFFCEHP